MIDSSHLTVNTLFERNANNQTLIAKQNTLPPVDEFVCKRIL
jgi:hypothetical protein